MYSAPNGALCFLWSQSYKHFAPLERNHKRLFGVITGGSPNK
jgi:hypothetical protein